MNYSHRLSLILTLSLSVYLVTACSSRTIKTTAVTPIIQESKELDESELLDVGVLTFDPGIQDLADLDEDDIVFAEVRTAESRFFSYLLVDTMQQSAAWGAIRVIPNTESAVDVIVSGKIIKSDGEVMVVTVEVQDATGKHWFNKEYEEVASKYSYPQRRRPNQQYKEP